MYHHLANETGFYTVDDIKHANQNTKTLLPVEKAVLFGEAGNQAVIDSRPKSRLQKYYGSVLNFLVK